ncbi:MAG: M23 family metallopeptidase [Candidatus Caldatribacteriota bacterium]
MLSFMRKLLFIPLLLVFLITPVSYSSVIVPAVEHITYHGEVKRGQGLYQALRDVSVDNALALGIINALSDEVEFSKLKVGDKLEATFNQNKELIRFSFSQNPAEKHVVSRNSPQDKWTYQFVEEKTFWHARILEGQLRDGSTLQNDLLAHGLAPSVVNEIINVLLLRVNFRMNARVGDTFKVLLNERKFQGETIQTKVLYTSYKGVRAGNHETFYYEDSEKSSTYTAHYTEEGEALINSALRYPLSSLHVRSGYGMRRHPVTGQMAMHRGVDLRGRRGAPVHAVADGRVVDSSYNQYAGNQIAIKHRDGSKSYYLHLDRRSVKKGDWVRSYQVIGTVGATGRVTGPHLHFGFKTPRGAWMNPLNKRMIATPKLKGQRLAKLREQIASIRGLVIDLEISKDAKYLLAEIPNQRTDQIFEWDFFNFYQEGMVAEVSL